MEINDLLKGMDCSCGRHHTCDIGYVSIAKGAIRALSALVSACFTARCDKGLNSNTVERESIAL